MRLEQLCRDVSHTRNHDVGGTGRHGKALEALVSFVAIVFYFWFGAHYGCHFALCYMATLGRYMAKN